LFCCKVLIVDTLGSDLRAKLLHSSALYAKYSL
jgi:hypothetical protein